MIKKLSDFQNKKIKESLKSNVSIETIIQETYNENKQTFKNHRNQVILSIIENAHYFNTSEVYVHLGHKDEAYWTEKEMLVGFDLNNKKLSESEQEIFNNLK